MGGILLDMMSMNKIHKIDHENCYAIVEPGVRVDQLLEAIGPGYMIAKGDYPDTHPVLTPLVCFKCMHNMCNRMWDNQVIGLEVVMPDGSIIYTGSMLYGDVEHWTEVQTAFAHVTNLFSPTCGSTGVITKGAVRIWPLLEKAAIHVFGFDDFSLALKWTHMMAKSPLVDSAMVHNWVIAGVFGRVASIYGLNWFECMANCDQDEPDRKIFPYPYYGFIQTRGYMEEAEGTLKASIRMARQFDGVYMDEEEIFKKPAVGLWYISLLGLFMHEKPEVLMNFLKRIPQVNVEELMRVGGWEANPTFGSQVAGSLNDVIRAYEGLKGKMKELGWRNFLTFTRQFHYGQTSWFYFAPYIDATTSEHLQESILICMDILKWLIDHYKVLNVRVPFFANDPEKPSEVTMRASPFRRLLRAVQNEFDPAGILNPLGKKYALM
jgi:hypothetical protein